jgi:hypothetical protein
VVPGRERDRESTDPAALCDRHAVHEERARAQGADPEASGRRRLVQPEFGREGHVRGQSPARPGGVTDPPGSGERVGKAGPRGHSDARENEKRGGAGEKAARGLPEGDR